MGSPRKNSDGGICTGVVSGSLRRRFSRALNSAVEQVLNEERKEIKRQRESKRLETETPPKYDYKHSDAEVLHLIRQHLIGGKSHEKVAAELGVTRNQAARWISGEARGRLRRQVDEELYKASKVVCKL